MEIELQEVARMLGLSIESREMVTGWSIDSRTVAAGDLFFALRGPNLLPGPGLSPVWALEGYSKWKAH